NADDSTWLQRFNDAGVPCAPLNTYSMVLDDPQVEHMQWVQPLELPNGVSTRTFASPLRFDDRTADILRLPRALGVHDGELRHPALREHNDEILTPVAPAD